MFKDIIIGQFIPGNSFLHRMDPRVKIVLSVLFVVLLFMVSGFFPYALMTVFVVFLVLFSGVPIKMFLKGLKPMAFILAFTVILNLFMTDGTPIFEMPVFGWFTLTVTIEGVYAAISLFIRLLYLITGTSLLTLTTSPLSLTDGIESLLRPLEKIKVPAHEIAMMMTIAMRFIPTLAEETDKIMKAQMARGADFESGNLIKRAKALVPLLVPLFVSAFRRADELATAMESRCYRGGKGRTKMKQMKITSLDMISIVLFFVIAASVITVNYLV